MPIGIKGKRAINPFLERKIAEVIAEAVGRSGSNGDYVGQSSVIAEAVGSAEMSELFSSSSSVIGEAVQLSPTWSNIWPNSSAVIAEAEYTDLSMTTPEGGGGSIDVYDEGVLVQSGVSCLDFIGVDIEAKEGAGDCVEIYSPAPTYVSHWNTTDGDNDATVADLSTASRFVSTPSGGEGTPFYSGGQSEVLTPTTRTSPITWASANECSFADDATTFTVSIMNGDSPQTEVVSFTTALITGNGVYAGSNCTVTITNWAVENDKYLADVSIGIDIDSIFPTAGYFDITMTHNNGADGSFTKSQ